jgi:hypothetical protein
LYFTGDRPKAVHSKIFPKIDFWPFWYAFYGKIFTTSPMTISPLHWRVLPGWNDPCSSKKSMLLIDYKIIYDRKYFPNLATSILEENERANSILSSMSMKPEDRVIPQLQNSF